MEDFKIIFYIAIGIAWFIYKNYQKVQQNRPKINKVPAVNTATSGEGKSPAAMALEKIKQKKAVITDRKFEAKKNFKIYQKTEESKRELIDEIKKKVRVMPSYLNTDMPFENIVKIKDTKYEMELNTESNKNSEEDLFDLKKFDIRTAIIYSEILKRPYA